MTACVGNVRGALPVQDRANRKGRRTVGILRCQFGFLPADASLNLVAACKRSAEYLRRRMSQHKGQEAMC